MEVCPKCGLPKEACVCEKLAKSKQKIKVSTERRRFGKLMTVIKGIEDKDIDIRKIAKELKTKLACGGTVKENTIELQGNHAKKVKEKLIELGFPAETIE